MILIANRRGDSKTFHELTSFIPIGNDRMLTIQSEQKQLKGINGAGQFHF